jgi:hypothetical protein
MNRTVDRQNLHSEYNPKVTRVSAATISLVAALMVILILVALHFLSPEFSAAQRMVSEYALGNYGWLLSILFVSWAISSWALAYALWYEVKTVAGKVGLILLIVSGVGEAMAAVFDVKHGLHGVAALLGIPTFPIAAILISLSLVRHPAWLAPKRLIVATALLTWIAVLSMTVTVIMMIKGSLIIAGYANRFLIVIYCVWLITVASEALRLRRNT